MRRTTYLGTLTIVTALVAGISAAAETEFIEKTRMSDTQQSIISHSGVVLIETVADARTDIGDRDYERAQREIRQASLLCRQIADASPALKLQNSFEAALKSLDPHAAKPSQQLAPIYRQLDVYAKLVDVSEIRAKVDEARSKLGAGEVEAAEADLKNASEKIRYFEVDLPINEAYQELGLAKDDFQRGDYRTADQRLAKIQAALESFSRTASIDVEGADAMDVAAPPPSR